MKMGLLINYFNY
uniref:Uncharacterized protein n=1 Tax=Cryptosporidium parvum TaxID=5807 RepID=F0X5A3_CRYPV